MQDDERNPFIVIYPPDNGDEMVMRGFRLAAGDGEAIKGFSPAAIVPPPDTDPSELSSVEGDAINPFSFLLLWLRLSR